MWVNRIFGPTIQGEGRSAGMLTMFLRLSRCNLACIFCDTPETWNWSETRFEHPEKYDRKKEMRLMSMDEIMSVLKEKGPGVRNLVISGGEPMLQQRKLILLLRMLRLNGYRSEIETNGTIKPDKEFIHLIDQINCSPKTSNSGKGNKPESRERPEALFKLASSSKTVFKFVVESENDLAEIKELVSRYRMRNVYLMAKSRTREDLLRLEPEVARMCLDNGFNFSPRLQLHIWNGGRDR